MKFNHKELEAIVRLTANPDFSLVISGIARHAEELNKLLVMKKWIRGNTALAGANKGDGLTDGGHRHCPHCDR